VTTSIPLYSVGRALARIGSLRGSRPGAAQAGGDSRAAILAVIEAAEEPVRVEELSEAVGLHPNTIRGHLDALLASGRISRTPDQRETRGRPHWLYTATSPGPIRDLARALDAELDSASASDVARLAAATWAESGPSVEPADSLDAAVDAATSALTDFGFDAVRNPVGDEITLRSCPYADLVEEHPVICDIHAALLGQVLRRTKQPVGLSQMDVFPRPGLCVAHLDRADAKPAWSVTPAAGDDLPEGSVRPTRTSTRTSTSANAPSRRKK
jgi:predicted ArsR family transcriptional regulator